MEALVPGGLAVIHRVDIIVTECSGPGWKPSWLSECSDEGFSAAVLVHHVDNRLNLKSPRECYNVGLEYASRASHPADLIVYFHDDVSIHDPGWLPRLLGLFDNSSCVAAGFGGALSLGHPDLYKRPYRLQDMARGGYRSNQTDWKTHGQFFTGNCRVAVLDAFCMAVRRPFLEQRGGWPEELTHHCLDLWLACEVARAGAETWITGVHCTHHGGGTSTGELYKDAKWLQGSGIAEDHQIPHKWIYDQYRDVLPILPIG